MKTEIPATDPAFNLLNSIAPDDLEKFWDLLQKIPVPVSDIADRLKIDIFSITLDSNISGLIKKVGPERFEIQVNNLDAPVRQRFTVCHEISHYLLHRNLIDFQGITDNILYRSQLSNKQEAEANKLAAAILLPWKTVNDWHNQIFSEPINKNNIKDIGRAFRASDLAVGFRFGV